MKHKYFVAKKDPDTNDIFVASNTNHSSLYSNEMVVKNTNWIRCEPQVLSDGQPFECEFKFQHTDQPQPCLVTKINTNELHIQLYSPTRALTDGQSFIKTMNAWEVLSSTATDTMSDQLDTCGEGLSDDSTDATIGEASDGKGGNGVSVGPTIMNLNDMKAGMQGLDSDRINQMIFEWSNGSHFHSFQTKRQKRIDNEIQYMKTRLSRMTEWQRMQCLKEADSAVSRLEAQRSMTRVIVHIDLDMFFAAVETKLRPELVGKPMAVGGDMMLATSNYEARKYGIRPGMPGALAKRLCPQLIIISHSSGSYSKESAEVMKIIREFDPNLNSSMSLDEAYIDLTDYVVDTYCHRHPDFDRQSLNGCKQLPNCLWDLAAEIVSNLRQRILDETQLSASAGIACNTMIAKVCSDINKPNGQHMIRGNRLEIENFLENTAIRKICGIGPVRGQFLTALGLKTCKDLYFKRDIIRFAFTQYNAEYYLSVGLGVGRHVIAKDEDERTRKSISSERTVSQISSFEAISELLAELSEELSEDLNSKNQSCKTVTIKLKKVTFVVTLRSLTLPFHTYDSETILNVAKSLLQTELNNTPPECRKYRLIGLKVSNLITNEPIRKSSQMTLSQIYRALKSNSNKETKEMNQICDETEKESKVEAEAKVAKEDNETKESLAINTTNDNKNTNM
ncbi:unnamed protein product, partial [Oppiella nova]